MQSIFPSQVTFWEISQLFQYNLLNCLSFLLPLSALHHPVMLLFKHTTCSDKHYTELGQETFSVGLPLAHVPVWSRILDIYQATDLSSFAEKDMGVLMDKLSMRQQCALAAKKGHGILGCLRKSITSRSKEVILCSALVRQLVLCPVLSCPGQERHRHTGVSPVNGHEDYLESGASDTQKGPGKLGLFSVQRRRLTGSYWCVSISDGRQ